jgi:enamine deaminase RidA (YjgF/YER057c/UK114 family)
MPKRIVTSNRIRRFTVPITQATLAGGFMFGCCTGARPDGTYALGDACAQTQQAIDDIRAQIEEAGGSLRDVVECTVHVTDRAYWAPMNEVYFANFAEDPPHRVSWIVQGRGSPGIIVEVDATAYLGQRA